MTHGHHRSTLLTPEVPFASRMQMMDAGEVAVVAIDGCSAIRLERSQPEDRVVLWLPRQGWVAERVNGEAVVAESGSAMLYLPGDELCGDTSLRLQGFSILLPFDQLGDPGAWSRCRQRHLEGGGRWWRSSKRPLIWWRPCGASAAIRRCASRSSSLRCATSAVRSERYSSADNSASLT